MHLTCVRACVLVCVCACVYVCVRTRELCGRVRVAMCTALGYSRGDVRASVGPRAFETKNNPLLRRILSSSRRYLIGGSPRQLPQFGHQIIDYPDSSLTSRPGPHLLFVGLTLSLCLGTRRCGTLRVSVDSPAPPFVSCSGFVSFFRPAFLVCCFCLLFYSFQIINQS